MKKEHKIFFHKIEFILTIILIGMFMGAQVTQALQKSDYKKPKECIVSITPTLEPTIGPLEPTATPSVQLTETPAISETQQNNGNPGENSTIQAPASATCTIPFSAPLITAITAGESGTLNVNWLESDHEISDFGLNYGLVGSPLNWGEANIPRTSRNLPIHLLPSGASINAQICAYKNGCGQCSEIVDPLVP